MQIPRPVLSLLWQDLPLNDIPGCWACTVRFEKHSSETLQKEEIEQGGGYNKTQQLNTENCRGWMKGM